MESLPGHLDRPRPYCAGPALGAALSGRRAASSSSASARAVGRRPPQTLTGPRRGTRYARPARAARRGWLSRRRGLRARSGMPTSTSRQRRRGEGGCSVSSCHHDDTLHRRDVLCGGGAALLGTIVTTLLGAARPARAEALAGTVPEVDRVAVTVVVDSYQFAVAPSAKVGDVGIE